VEDVYEEGLPNLDAFLRDLLVSLGETPYLHTIANVVHSFGVYFVLNMFDGVDESYETAIRPFVDYLKNFVSSRLRLTNLGWVVHDPNIHKANCQRRPILLQAPQGPKERKIDPIMQELSELESSVLGLPEPKQIQVPTRWQDEIMRIDADSPLDRQLEILNRMYRTSGSMQARNNFAYIAHRALHVIRNIPADSFGQSRLLTPLEIFHQIFPHQKR
jgi:hypothetical protein